MSRRVEHALYIPVSKKGSSLADAAVRAVSTARQTLRPHGITFVVVKVRPSDLRNPRVQAAFRRRGVANLPAVLAGGQPVVGVAAIREFYQSLMNRLSEASVQREVAQEVASRRRRRPPSSTGFSRQSPIDVNDEIAGMPNRHDEERLRHGSALAEIETRGGDSVDLDAGIDENTLHEYMAEEIRAAPMSEDDLGSGAE